MAGDEAQRIRRVRIVVPVRDEEAQLSMCLHALTLAMDSVCGGGIDALAVVVLDACADASPSIARAAATRDARIRVLERRHGSVGRARRDGVQHALQLGHPVHSGHANAATTWVCSTDADSLVPERWIASHLAHADAGADLLLGTVDLLPGSGDPALHERWRDDYRRPRSRPHIHGANLGVRASSYAVAGGFPSIRVHEDVGLVRAVAATGGRIRACDEQPVQTSARTMGRAPGGFSCFLSELGADGARDADASPLGEKLAEQCTEPHRTTTLRSRA